MKKFLTRGLGLLLASTMVMAMAGCSSGDTSSSASGSGAEDSNEEKVVLVLGNAAPASEENHMYQYCEKFKALVEEKSGGSIEIEIHPNGELGGERDLVEGVQLGSVDICFVASAPLGNFVEDTLAFDFPFLFKDFDHVQNVMDGEIGTDIAEKVEQSVGVKFLSWGVNGFRHFCNNVRPVKSPDDIKGLKVRTMENTIHMETFSALGADPTPMGTGELYTALQQGTVDGMEGPLTWILPSKYNEVQKYMSLTSHFYAPSVALMNQQKFDELSDDMKAIIEESAEEAESYQVEFCKQIDAQMAEEAADAGMEVIPESELDMEAFKAAVQSVYDAHPEFSEILNKIKEAE